LHNILKVCTVFNTFKTYCKPLRYAYNI
jgi:hypothetical protein